MRGLTSQGVYGCPGTNEVGLGVDTGCWDWVVGLGRETGWCDWGGGTEKWAWDVGLGRGTECCDWDVGLGEMLSLRWLGPDWPLSD